MTGCNRTRRALATIAFASIGVATGCSSVHPIGEASPAAAVAIAPDETPIVAPSTVLTATPSLPTLHELLVQDRFVPLQVALERTGLFTVIDGLDDFILFAPIGTAFASSGSDISIEYSTLMSNPRLLEAIMRYHIVADPATNQTWRTMNGFALDVDGSDIDTITNVDGIDILDRIPVQDGIVLVIPRILLPAPEPRGANAEPEPEA